MIFRLSEDIVFPPPALAEPDGLLAIGGDLSRERLLLAYSSGIFPWFSEGDPICWYAPHERCVIYPEKIKISKSMKKVIADGTFTVTSNQVFNDVIAACAQTPRRDQDGTWITTAMQDAYIDLHTHGFARSIEVWHGNKLVGGLYGIHLKGIFFGESMFSRMSNASKVALIWLCQQEQYKLIDCQLPTDHLISMGAEMIATPLYLAMIK